MVDQKALADYIGKAKRPVSFRELSNRLCTTRQESRLLKKLLRESVSAGAIVRTRSGLYGAASEMSLATGYFEAHAKGYGFVILEKPGARDVFVPVRKTAGAMNNDRVVVRIENARKRDGCIIRVLERAHTRIVGRLEKSGALLYLHPKEKSIPFDVIIPDKDMCDAQPGDTVIAEIVNFPEGNRPPVGKVVKKLALPDSPLLEIEAVIEELHLPKRFPRSVSEEVSSLSQEIDNAALEGRRDLRCLATFTMDGESAKDFDDAVSIARIPAGYRLHVHIADVGYFVPWDSALDKEALKRGTSVYFPDRAIPMLPRKLSEDLCSLKGGKDRLAFTVEMNFDHTGNRTGRSFYPSVINSNERMTYTKVRQILIDQDKTVRKRYEPYIGDFELMGELCTLMAALRRQRGSLDFDLPEPEIIIDMKGNLETIVRAERNFAHRIIEEFMIAANEAVAGFLEEKGMPCLYRIHEEPDETKLEDLMNLVKTTMLLKKKKAITAADFPLILKKAQGTPYEEAVSYLILRSLKQARYSPVNAGHFGLASESYCHFTSPIRRYPDLVVHRILRELIETKRIPDKRIETLAAILPDISFHCSRRERVADDAEREVVAALRTWFMKDRVGSVFEGKVIAPTAQGLRVRLNEYHIDGFVLLSSMKDDYYVYDEKNLCLKGKNRKRRFSISDPLTVRVERVAVVEREILFGIVGNS